jgi:hypothetical protein
MLECDEGRTIEFASLPGEFATVGKLNFIRKPLAHVELCPEKKWSLPVCHAF